MGNLEAQTRAQAMREIGFGERRRGPRWSMIVMALVLGAILDGCVVAPAPGYAYRGPGWCYWHPYRC
jgi:hypothetical protein